VHFRYNGSFTAISWEIKVSLIHLKNIEQLESSNNFFIMPQKSPTRISGFQHTMQNKEHKNFTERVSPAALIVKN
jgi:hypothetical protein